MKKILGFLFTVLCAFMLTSCGSKDLSSTYGLDKEVEIKEEVTLEEAIEEVSEANEEEFGNYFSVFIEMSLEGQVVEGEIKCDVSDLKNLKIAMVMKVTVDGEEKTQETYVKDGMMYTEISGQKIKVDFNKLVDDIDEYVNDMVEDYIDISEIISELKSSEEFKLGKDSKGNLIIEYKLLNQQARCVFDGAKLIFAATKEGESYTNITFSYSRPSIKFPDLSEYEEFSFGN